MKSKERVIIFVTAGKWQLNGIKIAKKQGLEILSIDSDPNAEGFKFSKYKINLELNKKEKIFKILKQYNLNYVGVLSYCSEAGMELASYISDYYNLYAPSIKTTNILVNKEKQRYLFKKNKINQPKFKIFNNKRKLLKYLNKNKKPLIVKPIDSSGSRGVFKLTSTLNNIKENIHNSFSYSKVKRVIAEDYIIGTELTVETFFQNGNMIITAITSKKKLKKTNDTVAYELSTYKLSNENYLKLKNIIYDCYFYADFKNGVGHAEIIKSKNLFYVVEIAGRGPGFDVFDRFIPLITEINIPKLLIKNSIGQNVKFKKSKNKQGIIRYFPSKKGKIINIEGFDYLNRIKNVYFKKIAKIGDFTNNANTDGDRLGYIISIDAQKKNAIKRLKQLQKKIKFKYK